MSFLSDGDHHHRRTKQQGTAEMTGPPALDLLDEYWFFSNSLVIKNNNNNNLKKKPPLLPRSTKPPQQAAGLGNRRLLRTPSLPSPRVGMEQKDDDDLVEDDQEVDDDDLNWSSIYEGVLRTRMAERNSTCRSSPALHRAPSMPVAPSPAEMATKSTPSMPRLRHSYSTLHRHHLQAEQTSGRREVRSFSANQQPMVKSVFQEEKKSKTWKSSSDLESIEVQGFKDLGFVFDKEELRENLADVLPGLKTSSPAAAANHHRRSGHVPRPYLSEAWHHVRRPPAAIRDARSAAEMKDQLRMWAQAVACNARQEC
ncbi:hypothetical protein EJB05_32816, partial [Eragrostis curvula]